MELAELGKYKNKIVNILIIITACVIAANIYKNHIVSIKILNSQKEEEMEKNAIVERIISRQKEFTRYKNFINNKNISNVLNNLKLTAKDTAVEILSMKPENPRNEGVYEVYPFSILINARQYSDIGNFISVLENDPKIFIIESVSFTLSRQTAENMRYAGAFGQTGRAEEKDKNINVNMVISTILIK